MRVTPGQVKVSLWTKTSQERNCTLTPKRLHVSRDEVPLPSYYGRTTSRLPVPPISVMWPEDTKPVKASFASAPEGRPTPSAITKARGEAKHAHTPAGASLERTATMLGTQANLDLFHGQK
jgi:hypothetical protein